MDRTRALEVIGEKWDDGPLIRLGEATEEACEASAAPRASVQVEIAAQAKASRVRHARVGVKKNA